MTKNRILAIGLCILILLVFFNIGCFNEDNNNNSDYVSWKKIMNDYEDNGFKSYEPGDKVKIKDDIKETYGDKNRIYIDFDSTSRSDNTLGKYDISIMKLSEKEMDCINNGSIEFQLTIEDRKDFDDKPYEWFEEAGGVGDWAFCFIIDVESG